MTQNLVLALGAQRNEDYGPETWRLTDQLTGDALDLTSWVFAFRISVAAGLTPNLVLGAVATALGSYVRVSEAANGCYELFISKEDIAALPGLAIDVAKLAYNMIMTDSGGFEHAQIVGPFTVRPGV